MMRQHERRDQENDVPYRLCADHQPKPLPDVKVRDSSGAVGEDREGVADTGWCLGGAVLSVNGRHHIYILIRGWSMSEMMMLMVRCCSEGKGQL